MPQGPTPSSGGSSGLPQQPFYPNPSPLPPQSALTEPSLAIPTHLCLLQEYQHILLDVPLLMHYGAAHLTAAKEYINGTLLYESSKRNSGFTDLDTSTQYAVNYLMQQIGSIQAIDLDRNIWRLLKDNHQ